MRVLLHSVAVQAQIMYCVAYFISMSTYYAHIERFIILSLNVYVEVSTGFKILRIQRVIINFWKFINVG